MQPFTTRRTFPLGPMPELRLERAPLIPLEYRGVTPRAALHRARREQLARLAYHADVRPVPIVLDSTDEREPSQIPWTVASIVILMLIVIGAIGILT